MLDTSTTSGKVVAAAMDLAATGPWAKISLREIAEKANVSMIELRKAGLSGKRDVLGAFMQAVDQAVLAQASDIALDTPPRDRLFDVLMSRFDVLTPYRTALRSIVRDAAPDPVMVCRGLTSQGWMMEAAGISADGVTGGIKATGLAAIYGRVFQVWLDDDEPDMSRTMAALDARLRRGERAIGSLDFVSGTVRSFRSAMMSCVARGCRRRGPDTADRPDGPSDPETEPGAPEPAVQFPDPPAQPAA